MAEGAQRKVIGDPAQIAFEIVWPPVQPADAMGLGWGELVLWVGGQRWWANDTANETPIRWTWIDLVEHLARAWAHLLYEENAPFGLTAAGPEALREPHLLNSVEGRTPIEVEDAVHAFQQRHDLAAGLKGITLPPVWLLREGNTLRIRAGGKDQWRPLSDVTAVLEAFVAEVLAHSDSAKTRSREARRRWTERQPSLDRILSLRTAMPIAELRAWTPPTTTVEAWWGAADDDSPLMAAARLSQPLKSETRRAVVQAIVEIEKRDTSALDQLGAEAQPVKQAVAELAPYAQGYALALWLRTKLALEDGVVDPAKLLKGWGVHVANLPNLEEALDAIACWGGGKGPAVLVNPSGRHSSSVSGRRATLAHEIAHLILDRGANLPAVEVLGGSTPLHLEQRARAFAAEFLLPREVAGSAVAHAMTLDEAADGLIDTYRVSREILAWQIRNWSGWGLLANKDRARISRWVAGRTDRERGAQKVPSRTARAQRMRPAPSAKPKRK